MLWAKKTYNVGQRVRLTGVFTANGQPADPSEVRFQIRNLTDATVEEHVYTEPSVVVKRSDIGVYYVVWTWESPGIWYYRFVGSGAIAMTVEAEAEVVPSKTLNQ